MYPLANVYMWGVFIAFCICMLTLERVDYASKKSPVREALVDILSSAVAAILWPVLLCVVIKKKIKKEDW